MKKPFQNFGFKGMRRSMQILSFALLMVFSGGKFLGANPVGENVIFGGATFDRTTPNQLLIQQSTENAIIHWNDFSISSNELTRFIQPGSGSSVLNRVVTGNPSSLLGSLQSNGKVFLINPNGILVGGGAQIQCGSFMASTLDIKNADFLNGVLRFSGDSRAEIQNFGKIKTTSGDLVLIGRTLKNHGEMEAAGKLGLYAGGEVLISQGEKPSVLLPGVILNEGTLTAWEVELRASGENPYALAINNSGKIKATGFVRGEGGKVSLVANRGRVKSTGVIDASGSRKGGKIEVTGDQVGIAGAVLANGSDQGGVIHLGGDWQGKGNLKNAQQVKVTPTAVIEAKGSRGEIVIWSDRTTEFYGSASIAGGGGKMEISGKESLNFQGTVDLGGTGSLLLDPNNIQIATANPGGAYVPSAISTDLDQFSDNPAQDSWLTPAQLLALLSSGDVTLQANTDVLFANAVDAGGALYSGRSLSVYAGRRVNFSANADLTLNGGNFYAKYNDENALGANRTTGDAYFQTINGADIITNGGNITVERGSYNDAGNNYGHVVVGNGGASTFNTGSGSLSITGARGTATNKSGISIDNGSQITTTSGNIDLSGTGKGGESNAYGLIVTNGADITSQSGAIDLTGTGGAGAGASASNIGLYITGSGTTVTTGSGNLSLTGTGGGGTGSANRGVYVVDSSSVQSTNGGGISISGTGGQTAGSTFSFGTDISFSSTISTTTGDLTINGYGGGAGASTESNGISFADSSVISSSNGGRIALNGYAAHNSSGVSSNKGINMANSASILSSGSGTISVVGVGNGTAGFNYGVLIGASASLASTGTGSVNITGTGGNGTTDNYGIVMDGTFGVSQVSSSRGNIDLVGTGNGSGAANGGVYMLGGTKVSSNGSANISIQGVGATSNQGVFITGAPTAVGGSSSTGNVTISAGTATGGDSIAINSGTITTSGKVNFKPINASDTIGVSGGTGTFNLSSTDLASITQASQGVYVGSADQTGLITVAGGSYSQGISLQAGGSNAAGIAASGTMTAGSGKDIVIASPNGRFSNNGGASVFNTSGGGRWLVYMDNEGDFNRNGLVESFQGWGAAFPTAPLKTGNGFMILNTPLSGGYRIFAMNQEKVVSGSQFVLNVSGTPRFYESGLNRNLGEDLVKDTLAPGANKLTFESSKGVPRGDTSFNYNKIEWSKKASPSTLFSTYQLEP